LLKQQDLTAIVERDDADRAGMNDDVTNGSGAARHGDLVGTDINHPPRTEVGRRAADWVSRGFLVADRIQDPTDSPPPGKVIAPSSALASVARLSAAAMNPTNNGWARVGRDLNSGWA
jgi:hypothetical protein